MKNTPVLAPPIWPFAPEVCGGLFAPLAGLANSLPSCSSSTRRWAELQSVFHMGGERSSVIHVLLPTLLTLATPSGTDQDYNLLQITKSDDVSATPSWHIPKELASQPTAKAGESGASLGSLPRVFRPDVGPCAVHNLINEMRDQTKADSPLINFQTFQHLQATKQLGRSFQKAIYDAKSNDDEQF